MKPLIALSLFVTFSTFVIAGEGSYSLKTEEAAPPTELKSPIKDALSSKVLQISKDGQLYCEVWLRKQIPADAAGSPDSGLKYRDLKETTLLGAVRFHQESSDYRMQPFSKGVYTIRLGFQPQDGDHMGTAPFPNFCVLVLASEDGKPGPMDPLDLQDASSQSIGTSHPCVMLLFPGDKPVDAPKLEDVGQGHWVLRATIPAEFDGKKTKLNIGLVVAGHSSAA